MNHQQQEPIIGGVYRHYKSTGGNHHTYKVIGIAHNTETDELMVIYLPLYPNEVINSSSANFFSRPLSMFMDSVNINGKSHARFELVNDPYNSGL